MTIRPKTRRRVGILLLGLFLALTVAGVFYFVRVKRINLALEQYRDDGMAACERGDYRAAVKLLRIYLSHRNNDLPAMKTLAFCSSQAPCPDGSNLSQSISAYGRYCALAPGDIDASHYLLELEQRYGRYSAQALSLATSLLHANPNDAAALKSLAWIYQRQHRYGPALDAATKFTRLFPDDLQMQRLVLELTRLNGGDPLAQLHPGDARASLLRAFALWYSLDPSQSPEQNAQIQQEAQRLTLDAAAADPSDRQFVLLTAEMLEHLGLFDAARNLLASACTRIHDEQLTVELVRRLWQDDRFSDALELLDKQDNFSSKTDARLIAFKAMSLAALGQSDSARPLVASLSFRKCDARALAWSEAIEAKDAKVNPATLLEKLRQACQYDPDEPQLRAMLGDAYAAIGQCELALEEMRHASEGAPAWVYPHIRLATLLTASGQGAATEAERQVQWLGDRVPKSQKLAAQIVRIQVLFARWQVTRQSGQAADLLSEIGTQWPAGSPMPRQIVPIYAELMARSGDVRQAISAITAAEKQNDDLDPQTLLRLAAVSRQAGLGQEQQLYELSRRRFGLTPQLAQAQARQMLAEGWPSEGFKFLQNARTEAHDGPEWDRALCLYREAAHDRAAAEAWKQLGDAYPADLGVQATIVLGEDAAWADRAFMSRSIDRLRSLTGDDSVTWKLVRARWFLESPQRPKDASAAIVLLGDVIYRWPEEYLPHMLMATAIQQLAGNAADPAQRQANWTAAVCEWKLAAQAAPNSPPVLCNLMLALSRSGQPVQAEAMGRQLLAVAQLARLQGRATDAGEIYLALSASGKMDAAAIAQAADFFASQCDLDTARQLLVQLDDSGLAASQREALLADFEEKYGSADDAAGHYAAAVSQSPGDLEMVMRQIAFLIRQMRWPQASQCIETALERWPDDATLAGDKHLAAALWGLKPNEQSAAFAAAAAQDPLNPAVVKAAEVLAEHSPAPQTLATLSDLLRQYPDFQPLYLLVIDQKLRVQELAEAEALGEQLMSRFSQSADAAETCVRLHVMARHWDIALKAAEEWRRRLAGSSLGPDRAIAAAEMFLGQPHQAAACLESYMPAAEKNGPAFVDPIMEYCDALIRAGRQQQAVQVLEPMARQWPVFRFRWLAIAISSHQDADSTLQWIELVQPLLAPDSFEEQKALAETYLAVGQKYENSKAYQRARETLKPLRDKGAADIMSLYDSIP